MQDNACKLSSLIFPLSTVLDESLGTAVYFASRGLGFLNGELYKSPCRVILIGSGADELFGGYSRHRTAFMRSSDNNDLLQQELNFDWVYII
jgi:asparagine synthetase B (glutamine-hydrolysing)